MKFVIRADASLQIGSGHVMRCLSLADELASHNASCLFICREHSGNLIRLIRDKGYPVLALPNTQSALNGSNSLAHSAWLGSTQEEDASACREALENLEPDWIIVDHYSLDSTWERVVKPLGRKLMVIDDLADRSHECDLLLDQNLGRNSYDYLSRISEKCKLLIGPQYSLLRQEFSNLRNQSLERKSKGGLRSLLVTMGGVDQHNATAKVLNALRNFQFSHDITINVVLGSAAPWIDHVKEVAFTMPHRTNVLVNIGNMASIMAESDLAIGAAGSTSWERCCLGLPTLMAILADNQMMIGKALHVGGAAVLIGCPEDADFEQRLSVELSRLANSDASLHAMSAVAAEVTNGLGCSVVADMLLGN